MMDRINQIRPLNFLCDLSSAVAGLFFDNYFIASVLDNKS
jgi:hypothetical protein